MFDLPDETWQPPRFSVPRFPEVGAKAPSTLGGATAGFVFHIDNADETMASAIAAGGTLDRPLENQHGHRSGWFIDPWGHRWSQTSPATD
jgi:PhnB protein